MKKSFLILICLILFIVSMAGVSAADDLNQTVDDTLSVSGENDEIISEDTGSFFELQKKIDQANESVIYLEKDYAFDDTIDSDSITIDKPITINGNGFTIDGKHVNKAFSIVGSAKNVVLNNITFTNTFTWGLGGAIESWGTNLTLNGCSFINSSTDIFAGGAVFVEGNLSVSGCNFVNNIAYTHVGPIGAMGYLGGGAIYVTDKLFASYCNFTNNYAYCDGNDIYVEDGVSEIVGCNFMNNQYTGHSIIVYGVSNIIDSNFMNSENSLIFVYGNLSINGSNFVNCSGDVIYVSGSSNLCASNCSFVNCSGGISGAGSVVGCSFVNGSGDAIYGAGSVVGCSFVNGSGGIYGVVSGVGSVVGCSFLNIKGCAVARSEDALISGCSFVDCSGDTSSGLVSGVGSVVGCSFLNIEGCAVVGSEDALIGGCSFVNCSGGAISGVVNLTVVGCSFINNTVSDFEADIIRSGSENTYIFNSTFINNTASGYEAIIIRSGSENTYIFNTTFINNLPLEYNQDKVRAENVTIIKSSHIITPIITIDRNVFLLSEDIQINIKLDDGATGKVIVNINGMEETLTLTNGFASLIKPNLGLGTYDMNVKYLGDESFSPNEKSTTLKIVEATFKDLQELIDNLDDGGIIELDKNYTYSEYWDNSLPIQNRKNIRIKGNGYTLDGNNEESIFRIEDSNVILENINFENARDQAISSQMSNLTVTNCSFVNNSFGWGGSVIICDRGNLTVTNCSFVNNSVDWGGGGLIICDRGNLSVVGCSFMNTDGVAIYIYPPDFDESYYNYKNVVSNCSFVNNGGCAVVGSEDTLISSCSFVNNSVGWDDVIRASGNLTVVGCSFVNNSVGWDGVIRASGNLTVVGCSFMNTDGVAIHIYPPDFDESHNDKNTVSNCSFVNTSGEVIVGDGNLCVSNCSFVNNSGEVIRASGNLTVVGCSFMNNSVDWSDGVIICDNGNLTVVGCSFVNCSGCAIDSNFFYDDMNVRVNLTVVGCSFVNCYGGAICCGSSDSDMNVCGNSTVVGCSFVNNTRDYRGAIDSYGNLTVVGCSFVNNRVSESGAAIANVGFLSVVDSSFVNNSGGAILSDRYLDVVGCTFEDNYLRDDCHGRAIYSLETSNNIINTTFIIKSAYKKDMVYNNVSKNCLADKNIVVCWSDYTLLNCTLIEKGGGSINLSAPDVTKYYCGSKEFVVSLSCDYGPIDTFDVNISIDGVDYNLRTNSKGIVSIPLNLGCGVYDAVVSCADISKTATITINPIPSETTLSINKNGQDSVTLTADVYPRNIYGDVVFTVNGENYTAQVSDLKATYALNHLADGFYEVKATYVGEGIYEFSSDTGSFVVKKTVDLSAPDVTKYYGGPEGFGVTLKELTGKPISNADVKINIDGIDYNRTTDIDGKAYMDLNLDSGVYEAIVSYNGVSTVATITVNQLDTEITISFTKNSPNSVTLTAIVSLTTATGDVIFTVDWMEEYAAEINGSVATCTLNDLDSGYYDVRAYYGGDINHMGSYSDFISFDMGEPLEPLIVLTAEDVSMDYGDGSCLTVTLTEDESPVAFADVNVDVDGSTCTITTYWNGKASMDINFNSGVYEAVISYNEVSTTAIITVNQLDTETALSYSKNAYNNVNLTAVVSPTTATGEVIFNVNGEDYSAEIMDSVATYTLNDLDEGNYDVRAYYGGDINHMCSYSDFISFDIGEPLEHLIVLTAEDVFMDYGDDGCLTVTLTEDGSPVAFADVNVDVNGSTYTITTGENGEASMAINFNSGVYEAVISYNEVSTTAIITVNQLDTETTLSFTKNSPNGVTLTADVSPTTATGEVIFTVNGEDYSAEIDDGKAIYRLSNLEVGLYEAKADYKGETNYKESDSNTITFAVEDVEYDVNAQDLIKYYHGSERFAVTVKDKDYNPVVGKNVTINLNGATYTRTTNENGEASMAINLNSGIYKVTCEFEGIEVQSTITVKSTVSGENVTKIFRNGTQYYATFVDTSGKTLAENTAVEFNINGVFYTRYTDDKGVARMNINLNPGEYVITAKNPNSGEMYTNVITVLPSIVENYDLTKYYRNASQYSLRLLDDKGNPVGAGVDIRLNINGVFYTRTSNASGHVKMNINLEPGEYIITAEYNGLMASNTIKVLSVIETKNLVMKYKDGSKFEAKILDGQGKAYPGQKVTFNINGVFYEKVTDENGIARLTINLMAGEYIITTSYNGLNAANKVTISS